MEKKTFLYFGFGSNLLTERIHYQNPSAVSKGAAELKDHRLEFRLPSKRWKGHAATITESEGNAVWGVLWQLDQEHLATLDEQEGVHKRLYERIKVHVRPKDGDELIEAISYRVQKHNLTTPVEECAPSRVYKNVMIRGALENSLPDFYVEKLRQLVDNGYEGEVEVGLPLHLQD